MVMEQHSKNFFAAHPLCSCYMLVFDGYKVFGLHSICTGKQFPGDKEVVDSLSGLWQLTISWMFKVSENGYTLLTFGITQLYRELCTLYYTQVFIFLFFTFIYAGIFLSCFYPWFWLVHPGKIIACTLSSFLHVILMEPSLSPNH